MPSKNVKPSKSEQDAQSSSKAKPASRVRVRMNVEGAPTYYSNSAEIMSSIWDFMFKLSEVVEATPERIVTKDLCKIIMSPSHAKVFAGILGKKIKEYEDQHGELPIPK